MRERGATDVVSDVNLLLELYLALHQYKRAVQVWHLLQKGYSLGWIETTAIFLHILEGIPGLALGLKCV